MREVIVAVHFIIITLLAFVIYRKQGTKERWFWPAFDLKLFAGLGLGALYTSYYQQGDTFLYFADATALADLARNDVRSYLSVLAGEGVPPAISLELAAPRALFFSRIVSVFALLTNDNYWATSWYFSFFSFLGSMALVKSISRNIPSAANASAIAFLFMPSVVIWTSGVVKESLAMAALFYLAAGFVQMWFGERIGWTQIVLSFLSLWILWHLKYYYAGVFIAVAGPAAFYRWVAAKVFPSQRTRRAILSIAFAAAGSLAVTFLHPNFRLHRLLEVVVENNAVYHAISEPGHVVQFHDLQPTLSSMLVNAPWALISGLFRPFVWDATSVIQLLAGLENLVLLFLFLTALRRADLFIKSSHRLLLLSVVLFVAALSIFLTLSAPNFGTLSRYRAGYISFFALIILCNNPVLQYVERSITGLFTRKQ